MRSLLKAYATPLVIAGFAAIGVTGLIMFFNLDARGLNSVHKWIGLLFVLAGIAHVTWNWRALTLRFRQTNTVVLVSTLCIIAALIVGAVQFGLTGAGRRQNGPRLALLALSHAPLRVAAPALGIKLGMALDRLKAKGYAVAGAQQSLSDIAHSDRADLGGLFTAVMKR